MSKRSNVNDGAPFFGEATTSTVIPLLKAKTIARFPSSNTDHSPMRSSLPGAKQLTISAIASRLFFIKNKFV